MLSDYRTLNPITEGISPQYWQRFFSDPAGTMQLLHGLQSLPETQQIINSPAPIDGAVTDAPIVQDVIDKVKDSGTTVATTPEVASTETAVTTPAPTAESLRSGFLKEADSKFGSNFGNRVIGSSLLDDAITKILGEQRTEAQAYLDRGKARGIYNDIGYNAGNASINNAALAGGARVRGLGDDLISNYRTGANSIRDRAYEAIGGVTADRSFSLDPYVDEANDFVSRATANAEGDLRNALGGSKLFDFSALNNNAGQAQGALNMRDADVATALRERRRVNSQTRGLGSTGAF